MCSSDCLIIIIFYSSILNFFVTKFLCIVRSCWLYLSYTYVPFFFFIHVNFKNLNVLFPKKKSHKYPFDETRMTLMTTTDIILIFLILYSTSSLYLKCLILLCWNFVCFRHMYYVCTDLLMLHYNLFLMSFVFDIIYLI